MRESGEAPAAGGELRIASLTLDETALVDQSLPPSRLDQEGIYLIAWDGQQSVAQLRDRQQRSGGTV